MHGPPPDWGLWLVLIFERNLQVLTSPPTPTPPTHSCFLPSSLVLGKSPQPVVSRETTGPPQVESRDTEQQKVSLGCSGQVEKRREEVRYGDGG